MRRQLSGERRHVAPDAAGAGARLMTIPMLDLVAQYQAIKDEVVPAMMKVVETQQFIMGPSIPQLGTEVARPSHAKHGIGCPRRHAAPPAPPARARALPPLRPHTGPRPPGPPPAPPPPRTGRKPQRGPGASPRRRS